MRKRQVNHVVRALKAAGFYPDHLPEPGEINADVLGAIQKFLHATRGKDVKRVIHVLKSTNHPAFRHIESDCVNLQVRQAVRQFLKEFGLQDYVYFSDEDCLRSWEIGGLPFSQCVRA